MQSVAFVDEFVGACVGVCNGSNLASWVIDNRIDPCGNICLLKLDAAQESLFGNLERVCNVSKHVRLRTYR